jgi:maltose alpha-D-glucosyltransferase/alpha-amylase
MEFLHPENRHVLAYLRRYRGETLLCLANLSRYVQPVELNLAEFDGWTPVEMIGRTEFPTIGELPYFLTVGPHAFYWFLLEPQPEPIIAGHAGRAKRAEQLRVVTLERGVELLDDASRYVLETEVLPHFLRHQRWFRSKARELGTLRLLDWCHLGAGFYVTVVEIRYADGETERYALPVKAVTGKPAEKLAEDIPASVMARLRTPRTEGIICDALADRTSCRELYAAIVDGRQYDTARDGGIRAFTASNLRSDLFVRTGAPSVRRLSVEQSNTSIVMDEAYVLKFFRQLEDGPNPDLEMGLHLTERTGFTGMARVYGGMAYVGRSGAQTTIAMLQDFVANEGDGWQHGLQAAREFLAAIGRRHWPDPPPIEAAGPLQLATRESPEIVTAAAGTFPERVRELGRRTAEFHRALAGDRRRPDFAPRAMTTADLEALADACTAHVHEALELLNRNTSKLAEAERGDIDLVLTAGPRLIARFQDLPGLSEAGQLIRIHGDYHLGQVLVTEDRGWLLLDFEGEPLLPLAERRQKQSPLKDIAGMIRSFDYAAQTVRHEFCSRRPERLAAATAWAEVWNRWMAASFLAGYLDAMGDRPPLATSEEAREVLLDTFLLDKTFYELKYELNNRPDWVHIPLAGILDIITRTVGPENGEGRG